MSLIGRTVRNTLDDGFGPVGTILSIEGRDDDGAVEWVEVRWADSHMSTVEAMDDLRTVDIALEFEW